MKIREYIICLCLIIVFLLTGCKKKEVINPVFTFNDVSVEYDGKIHELSLDGELPNGYHALYNNNKHSEIGKHNISVKVVNDKTNKVIYDKTAILEIKSPTYFFGVETFNYDGKTHNVSFEADLPDNVEVRYENNNQTIVGSYSVKASLYNKEANCVDGEFFTTLDIKLNGQIENKNFICDGTIHNLDISSEYLDDNPQLIIEYENNYQKDFGKYYVKGIIKNELGDVLEEYFGIMKIDNPKNELFESFIDELFISFFDGDQMSINQLFQDYNSYGLKHQEATLVSYVKDKSYQEGLDEIDKLIKELDSYYFENLSFEEQTTYEIVKSYLEYLYSITEEMNYMYNPYLGSYLGAQCELPFLLAEYNFREEQDIIDFLLYLKSAPEVFKSYYDFTSDQVERGYGLSDVIIDGIIEQCNNFVSMGDENFLISLFNNKIDAITFELLSSTVTEYKQQAEELIKGSLTNAYAFISDNLEKLKGKALTDGALGSFGEEGKKYYRLMLSNVLGIKNITVDGLFDFLYDSLDRVNEQLMDSQMNIAKLNVSEKNKLYNMLNGNVKNFSSSSYDDLFDDFKEYAKLLVPELSEQPNITLKRVPDELKENFSPAAYILSPLDETKNESVYFNPLYKSNYNYMFTTLAHEGYPGHLYQNVYSKNLDINKIRQIIRCSGYMEGWATYVEYKAYYFSPNFRSSAEKLYLDLVSAQNKKVLIVQALFELYVHYSNCGSELLRRYIEELLGYKIATNEVESVYEQLISTPTNSCMYIVSCEVLNQLHDYVENILREDFDEVTFNKVILDNGSAPLDIVIESVNTFVYDYLYLDNRINEYNEFMIFSE